MAYKKISEYLYFYGSAEPLMVLGHRKQYPKCTELWLTEYNELQGIGRPQEHPQN
jgi:hypothetical protein